MVLGIGTIKMADTSLDDHSGRFDRAAIMTNVFERFESTVQNAVRAAPIVFDKASGSELFDERGNRYVDFNSAGGSQSFGHCNIKVCSALIDYLCNDRIMQSRDRRSVAKRNFIEAFVSRILRPQGLDHKILFTDPASGVATEIALRIARRHKQRSGVVAFTNSIHGLTEASLAVTSAPFPRGATLDFRNRVAFMPYCAFLGEQVDTIGYLRRYLEESASGLELPAAAIVETTQVHGGVNVASDQWLKGLEALCREFGILLIVDETHTGFGRSGGFFSFEAAGLNPDMILVSNAIASGLPISIVLLRPDLDHWQPGDQVGAFQGDNLAFVAATEVLAQWDAVFAQEIAERSKLLAEELSNLPSQFPNRRLRVRGKGMVWALEFDRPASAAIVAAWALERGLIIEPARLKDDVLLVLPPLTIGEDVLREGLDHLNQAVSMFLKHE
jgi:diaminobutyrate-2-oxoglutarate transaminase